MPGKKSYDTMPSQGIVGGRQSGNTDRFQQQPSDGGRITYTSINHQEHSAFQAESSEDSPLAARLLKISLQNQPEYQKPRLKSRERLEGRSQRLLTEHAQPVPQPIGITSPPDTSSLQYTPHASSAPRDGYAQQPHHHSSINDPAVSQQSQQHPQSSELQHRSRVVSSPAPPPPPPEVYRFERDGQVEYYKRAPSGELRISAPTESQEARVMEYAAAQLSSKQEYPRSQVSGTLSCRFIGW